MSSIDAVVLKRYSDTLALRAERGDEEAKLAILLAAVSGESDEKAELEASSWLEVVCARGENVAAMYYYGLYLATGAFEEIALHEGGQTPEKPYYIDVDRLDDFLGLDRGVSPDGDVNEPFDFKKWLRSERKRRMAEQKESEPLSAPNEAQGSCSDKRADRLRRAEQWLRKAADSGHERALVTLMLVKSNSSAQSDVESEVTSIIDRLKTMKSGMGLLRAAELRASMELYELAAQTEFPEAMYRLALIASESDSEDHQLLYWQLLNKASSSGHKEAQYHLAQLEISKSYESGEDGEISTNFAKVDEKLAFALFKSSATPPNADRDACFVMGNIYYEGLYGQAVNLPLAFKYWKRGAKLGDPSCMVNMGTMYYHGTGTKQDFEKAFYCSQNAAVLGSRTAMQNLVDFYERGVGVPQSSQHAQYYRNLLENEGTDQNADAMADVLEQIQKERERDMARELTP